MYNFGFVLQWSRMNKFCVALFYNLSLPKLKKSGLDIKFPCHPAEVRINTRAALELVLAPPAKRLKSKQGSSQ